MPDPDKSLLERLAEFLTPQPTSATERRQELIETLRAAQTEGFIDADALSMIEGFFRSVNCVPGTSLYPARKLTGLTLIPRLPR